MELYHEIKDNDYVVILAGNLDRENAYEIDLTLRKAIHSHKDRILVDCRNLNYITSEGIGIFLSSLPLIREKGMDLVFCGLQPKTKEIFEILGLDKILLLSDVSALAS